MIATPSAGQLAYGKAVRAALSRVQVSFIESGDFKFSFGSPRAARRCFARAVVYDADCRRSRDDSKS